MVRPPLKNVAALAGVSEPTVSRVLNGRPGVAARTRERVIDALQSLGFDAVPGPQSSRRGVVGVITGEFLNPVFATFAHHISTDLGRKGFLTTIAVTDTDFAPEQRCIAELTATGVDGIVFIGGRHSEVAGDLDHYRALAESGTPFVLVNGAATDLPVPHVWCDEEAGARKGVAQLVKLGHTRIGCLLGSPRFVPTARFVDGWRRTLADAGIEEPDGAVIETAFTLEGGRAGATRLLDRGITAMIAGNDLMALGAVLAGGDREISVVGYDGTDFTAMTAPPLTTLRQPFEDMAQLITDAIVSEIDGSARYRDHYVFEPELVSRESTHAAAALSISV